MQPRPMNSLHTKPTSSSTYGVRSYSETSLSLHSLLLKKLALEEAMKAHKGNTV